MYVKIVTPEYRITYDVIRVEFHGNPPSSVDIVTCDGKCSTYFPPIGKPDVDVYVMNNSGGTIQHEKLKYSESKGLPTPIKKWPTA